MSKLFAYSHKGAGGCGKTAFFTLARPQAGQSLADCVVISTSGEHVKTVGALMCGHCGNGVLDLRLDNLKPARMTNTIDLLVKSVNSRTMSKAEVQVLTTNLQLMHELCSKIHPSVIPYVGSALESSVKDLIGADESCIITGQFD